MNTYIVKLFVTQPTWQTFEQKCPQNEKDLINLI